MTKLSISCLLVVLVIATGTISTTDAQYHRMYAPSAYLPVNACRDIPEGIYGDPKGTCASLGYAINCTSCHGLMVFPYHHQTQRSWILSLFL